MQRLVGDIGGTKTHLALAAWQGGRWTLTAERRYPSRDYPGLGEMLTDYLAPLDVRPDSGAFAIAGPVLADRCTATNLPWQIDARALEAATGLAQVRLLNDLEAIAWGIAELEAEQWLTLQSGDSSACGNAAVVAPGTGLGQAGLFWDGTRHHPFATEGGHSDFAPRDAREFALLQHLSARFGRVSWERVVSGMGIALLYPFLCQYRNSAHHPEVAAVIEQQGDVAASVARLAQAGACPICQETMTLFMELLGRELANTALKLMARGGVYLAGGIVPKNLALAQQGDLLRGFLDKGRMRALLEAMPVRVVLEERVALLGAARYLHQSQAG